ncbi:hypothetical protein EV363DRAFT_807730 [Boletus edulis]|nr:hypothetical protein EV363DRAFT_807730 [Boletus edulis]
MSGSGLSSERLPQNPVRIVYRAGNRTFARLFNERSLEEVKDVVRRKLGLGSGTDVSLKQMGSDALLDLEDVCCVRGHTSHSTRVSVLGCIVHG